MLIVANACQTVDETLDQFKFGAGDPDLLERNNSGYLDLYRAMIPEIDGERREIVDAVNHVRRGLPGAGLVDEHNSSSLNGVYLYDFLCRQGYAGRTELVDNIDLEAERAAELAKAADVVLLSTTFITSASTIVRVCKLLKSWNPKALVIVGGAKLTQYSDDREIHGAARAADALILSPNGERTLLEVIRRLVLGESIASVPNIAYDDGEFRCTSRNLHDGVDIDANSVRWDELPDYILRTSVNVRTGRGCPFKCKFCTFPSYNDQQVDLMETESVVHQLRQIMRLPQVGSVRFVDDTLFLNRNHLITVCRRMIDIGFDKPWTAYLRAPTLTDECVRYLSEAGCRLVLVGVESADQAVLNNMLKGTREKHNWVAAENLAKYDVMGFAFMLVGFPGETQKSVSKSIDFLNNSGIHSYVHSPLFVFPNSPLAREARDFGLKGGFNDWAHDTMDCRTAVEECGRMFAEVHNAAYIDRGSSVTKTLLDHGASVGEASRMGVLHNETARRQGAGLDDSATRAEFAALAAGMQHATARSVDAVTTPYSRVDGRLEITSPARY
ncbi:radical SAM protein [Amycolatopsis sp. SID8362]|uniref:B12-binding domain-containing radical SAM protein n=1 Tax=Amycolatopsis sp. SID8362 TaxID=2690346 RepID=UPI00136AF60B|nr:radical SAM protein [Amycolatopsis sp. SID8362]NBH08559.1 radical SAM protein [Amycolatopsis sp. SID8362]NED45253.1 radical SAM protein [Amycolatopsis sp. SID8362]